MNRFIGVISAKKFILDYKINFKSSAAGRLRKIVLECNRKCVEVNEKNSDPAVLSNNQTDKLLQLKCNMLNRKLKRGI